MTPEERERFDLEIYLEIKDPKHRGCIGDAADYLHHKNPDRVSRLVNPGDSRANTIFGELADLLEGFNHRHPALAQFIWRKLSQQVGSFMDTGSETIRLDEFVEAADAAAREQFDVSRAVMLNQPVKVIQKETFEALEKARLQHEMAMKLGTEKQ